MWKARPSAKSARGGGKIVPPPNKKYAVSPYADLFFAAAPPGPASPQAPPGANFSTVGYVREPAPPPKTRPKPTCRPDVGTDEAAGVRFPVHAKLANIPNIHLDVNLAANYAFRLDCEEEKTKKLQELSAPEATCRDADVDEGEELSAPEASCRDADVDEGERESEDIQEESEIEHVKVEENVEEIIRETRRVLQQHLEGHRSNRGRSYQEMPAQSTYDQIDINDLRYSQLSCKDTFVCGRSVKQLVQDLLDRKVRLSAPFLRLTVFETEDERTNAIIYRCIDNRRLFALKEYARRSGKDRLMVNVELISLHTLMQVQRYIHNSDDTDGLDVRLREPWKQGKHGKQAKKSKQGNTRNRSHRKRK